MTGDVVLLAVLFVPVALWLLVRWLPDRRRTRTPRPPAAGPRKRWWQP